MTKTLDTVVFDLGGVLIEVGYRKALDWLAARGFSPDTPEEFMTATQLRAHERGELPAGEFFDRVNSLLATPATHDELHAWWTGFFAPDADMLALARRLRGRYRVFVLSNTGPLHWQQAMQQFALHEVAENFLTSFEAGVCKPEAAIYAAAETRFELQPRRTVFIDDLAENIVAARDAGWHGIRHTDFAATQQALEQLGVT